MNAQVPVKLRYHQTFCWHLIAIIVMPLFIDSVLELVTCNWSMFPVDFFNTICTVNLKSLMVEYHLDGIQVHGP